MPTWFLILATVFSVTTIIVSGGTFANTRRYYYKEYVNRKRSVESTKDS